jgi:predicted acyltransferase
VSHTITQPGREAAWRWPLWTARGVTAAGLAIDAYVHLNLASQYAESGGTINEGVLFRVEAAVAVLAAVAVIATRRLAAQLAGLVVAGSALAVMLVSRYLDLGPIGPFPSLYDPVWYPEKLLAAFAEGAAAAAALAGTVITVWAWRKRRTARPARKLTSRYQQQIQQEEYQHDSRIQLHCVWSADGQDVPGDPPSAPPPPPS